MILLRRPVKYRAWWDTKLCRAWEFTALSADAVNGTVTVRPKKTVPANDRDHLRW